MLDFPIVSLFGSGMGSPGLRVKASLFRETRDRKGLLEVFLRKRLPQADDLVCKRFLSRDGGNCIGSILSPHDGSLVKALKLPTKEESI